MKNYRSESVTETQDTHKPGVEQNRVRNSLTYPSHLKRLTYI